VDCDNESNVCFWWFHLCSGCEFRRTACCSMTHGQSLVEKGAIVRVTSLTVLWLALCPRALKEAIADYEGILFADICKEGPGGIALSPSITMLQKEVLLPNKWLFAGAPRKCNPLGSTENFLNVPDIEEAFTTLSSVEKSIQASDHKFAWSN